MIFILRRFLAYFSMILAFISVTLVVTGCPKKNQSSEELMDDKSGLEGDEGFPDDGEVVEEGDIPTEIYTSEEEQSGADDNTTVNPQDENKSTNEEAVPDEEESEPDVDEEPSEE